MQSWTKPTLEQLDQAFSLVKKEIDRTYFFSRLRNPNWLEPLVREGFFKSPPPVKTLTDGTILVPNWPELAYLKNIASTSPDSVLDTVLGIPETDNPRVYEDYLEIILEIDPTKTAVLHEKVLEYLKVKRGINVHLIIKVIKHWLSANMLDKSLALASNLIRFEPDIDYKAKKKRYLEDGLSLDSVLTPRPKIAEWDYVDLLIEVLIPISKSRCLEVSILMADECSRMLDLSYFNEMGNYEADRDYSEIWCPKLDSSIDDTYNEHKEILVIAAVKIFEDLFENHHKDIEKLDNILKKKRWQLFRRVREFLYSRYPNEVIIEGIRELILSNDTYDKYEHSYEFQLMINQACQTFGDKLLSKEEKKKIFAQILQGPSKEDFIESIGEDYSEDLFEQRKKYFHYVQLYPFSNIFSSEINDYFQQLAEENSDITLSDETYATTGTISGFVTYKSPKSLSEIEAFSNIELLDYLNNWEGSHRDTSNPLVEININALADVFQKFFVSTISANEKSLEFWLNNYERIEKIVFLTAIMKGITEIVKSKNFSKLDLWLDFSLDVLNCFKHERDNLSIYRAILDLVDTSVDKEVNVPLEYRNKLLMLLRFLYNFNDTELENKKYDLSSDLITIAINTTRGRAIESLLNYGSWVKAHNKSDTLTDVAEVVEQRFSIDTPVPLTLPEYAMHGLRFNHIYSLVPEWLHENKHKIFDLTNFETWSAAFLSFLKFNRPFKPLYDFLLDNYQFALDHTAMLIILGDNMLPYIDRLGQHIHTYYLWGLYSLDDESNLLDQFYLRTSDNTKLWANLFRYVGSALKNSSKNLDKDIVERVKLFFTSRLQNAETAELSMYTYWLDAEMLEPEWRLTSYSQILDLKLPVELIGHSIEERSLTKLLDHNEALVIECFSKLMDSFGENNSPYILPEYAKKIISRGLTSDDKHVRDYAENAREKLLRMGRFEFMEL